MPPSCNCGWFCMCFTIMLHFFSVLVYLCSRITVTCRSTVHITASQRFPCGPGLNRNETEPTEETPFQAQVKSGWNFFKGPLQASTGDSFLDFFFFTTADVGLSWQPRWDSRLKDSWVDQSEGAGLITRKTPGAIGPAHRCQPHSIMPCLAFERETHTRTDPFDPGEGLQTPVLLVARSTTGLGVKARNKNPYWVSCCPPPQAAWCLHPSSDEKGSVLKKSLETFTDGVLRVPIPTTYVSHFFYFKEEIRI